MTASVEALPLVRRITEHAYRAGATPRHDALLRRGGDARALPPRAGRELRQGDRLALRRHGVGLPQRGRAPRHRRRGPLAAGRPGSGQGRARQPRPLGRLHAGPEAHLAASTSTGTSSPMPRPPGRRPCSRTSRPTSPSRGCGTPSSPPRASTRTIRSRPGPRTTSGLHARARHLNERRYASLRFRGPGTDLTVGLADDHEWHGGSSSAKNGIVCNPNIPTEEVFTTPHRDRVERHGRAQRSRSPTRAR